MWDGNPIFQTAVEVTDDGVRGQGGAAVVLAASYGGGKSTLLMQIAQLHRWVDNRYTKKDFFEDPFNIPVYKTTALWFPGQHDHWNAFLPGNAPRCFPAMGGRPKGFLLHHHEDDHLTFFESPAEGMQQPLTDLSPDLRRTYHDEKGLFATIQREGEGKVNVVFPPQNYVLSPAFREAVYRMIGLEKRDDDDGEVKSEPHIFYHQLINHLLEEKDSKHIAIFYDDVTRFIQAYQTDVNFHLINLFASRWFPAMRKRNISFFAATHDVILIDWKVLDRFKTYLWFTSSILNRRLSQLRQGTIRNLGMGDSIIEDRVMGFGKIRFHRIPHQPPVVITKGVTA